MKINLKFKKAIDFYIGGLGLFLIYFPVRLVGLLLRRNHDLSQPQHLVFIKLLGGGSLLMAQPLIFHLRKKYPNLQISLICGQSISHFAESYKLFDQIRVIDDRSSLSFLLTGLKNLVWLFHSADVSVDLEVHSRMTTLYTTLALVKNRIGLVDHQSLWRRRIYTHSIYVNALQNIPQVYDSLWALFGGSSVSLSLAQKEFEKMVQSRVSVEAKSDSDIDIGLGIGCSDLAYERQLSVQDWATLILQIQQGLQDLHLRFVFLGGKADRDLAEQIMNLVSSKATVRFKNFCGELNLGESMSALASCRAFLAIDSALIHLARFLKVPSVSFWGPTAPTSLLRPLPLKEKFFYKDILCSPCVHFTENPPCEGRNICMQHSRSFSEAVRWIQDLLKEKSASFTELSPNPVPGGVLAFYPLEPAPRRIEMEYEFEK